MTGPDPRGAKNDLHRYYAQQAHFRCLLKLRINLENLSGFNRCEVRARLSNQELRKGIAEIEHA
jgi:hypothetical protein